MALDTFNPYLFVSSGEQSNKFLTPTYADGIAKFQAQRAQSLTGLTVRINSIQSGTGDPYPPGGGINKIALSDGIDFTLDGVRYYTKDGNLYLDGKSIGETSSTNPVFSSNLSFVLSAGTYYYSRMSYGNAVYLRSDSGNIVTNNGTFTLSESTTVWLAFYIYNKTFNNEIVPCMLVNGSTAPSSYAPFSNIRPISGRTGLTVATRGKNLFDKTAVTGSAWLSTTTGEVESTSSDYVVSDYILVKKGVTVYIPATTSVRRWFYDVNKTPTTYLQNSVAQVFTPTEDGYIRATIKTDVVDIDTFQIEFGTSATAYEPYAGHTYPVTWETEAGTVYGGTLDVVSGVLTVDKAWYAFNGTEGQWNKSSTYRGSFYRSWSIMPSGEGINQGAFICSHAGYISNLSEYAYGKCVSDSALNLWVIKDTDATIDDFKAFLAEQYANGTPVAVCYTLATPQTYRLTGADVRTIAGFNQIYSDAGPIIDIKF